MTKTGFWGELDLAPGESETLDYGTLRLAVERTQREVWLHIRRTSGGGGEEERPGEESEEWRRWAMPESARLSIRPAAPDRLVVVSQEHPFHLPSHAEARVYVRIPLFVRVVASGPDSDELVLADVPSIVLSDTWWGTFTEGELAYWLTTTARSEVSDDLFLPHVAMCPFRFANRSEDALPVERFAVRVPHLTLFADGARMWTDEVRVRYAAAVEGSEIGFGGRAPAESPGAERVAPPRVPVRRRFHARTFGRLLGF